MEARDFNTALNNVTTDALTVAVALDKAGETDRAGSLLTAVMLALADAGFWDQERQRIFEGASVAVRGPDRSPVLPGSEEELAHAKVVVWATRYVMHLHGQEAAATLWRAIYGGGTPPWEMTPSEVAELQQHGLHGRPN